MDKTESPETDAWINRQSNCDQGDIAVQKDDALPPTNGRKAMINLDTVLNSRDINLSTKVRLVKAMVFPVIMYGYESWTIKKA